MKLTDPLSGERAPQLSSARETQSRPEFRPLSVLRTAWKQKAAFTLTFILLAGAGIAAFQSLPTKFRAETLILVEAQQISERLVDSNANVDLQDRLATLQRQMLSTARLQALIQKHGLYSTNMSTPIPEHVIESMREDITIKLDKGWSRNRPGAIRVTYTGDNAVTVAEVANELGHFFVDESARSREQHAEGASEFLAEQVSQARKELADYDARLMAYKQTHSGELPEQAQVLLATISRLQISLQGRRDAVLRAQQHRAALEASLKNAERALAEKQKAVRPEAAPPAVSAPLSPTSSGSTTPVRRSTDIAEQLAIARVRYMEQHPVVKALAAELEAVKRLEAKEAANRPAGTAPAPGFAAQSGDRESAEIPITRETVATLRAQLEEASKEEDQRQQDAGQVSRELQSAESGLSRVPVHEQQLLTLARDYEGANQRYKTLTEKNFAANMSADMERSNRAERFAVLEPALVPEKPFSPDRRKGGIAIAGLALGLAAAFAFIRELRRNVVLGEWELPGDIPILSRVPDLS